MAALQRALARLGTRALGARGLASAPDATKDNLEVSVGSPRHAQAAQAQPPPASAAPLPPPTAVASCTRPLPQVWKARASKEAKGADPWEAFSSTNTDVRLWHVILALAVALLPLLRSCPPALQPVSSQHQLIKYALLICSCARAFPSCRCTAAWMWRSSLAMEPNSRACTPTPGGCRWLDATHRL